jgi:transposase
MRINCLTRLLGIQGYRVTGMSMEQRKGREAVVLELNRQRRDFECGKCHRRIKKAHSSWMVEIQHLTLWHFLTFLQVRHYRVYCPDCGLTLEPLSFVAEGARVSQSLASLVAELCKVMTIKAAAIFQSLHRGTVKTLDKLAMEAVQASRPLDGITVVGIDEIAVGKGQSYWHLVSALEGPRGPELLFVGEGRKERHLAKFWKWFGKDRARGITHGVIDMWKPFRNSILANCPEAKIIYDKFHVIQHLLKALNDVRKQELRKAAGRFRGLLAGKKFILLSRRAHVRGKSREALNTLLSVNRRLFKAHLLKESFDHLWSYSSKTWATKFFRHWVDQLKWSRLKPYHKFAHMIENHLDGILNYCDKKASLGYIESANLKARNVIRMAYGYRDKKYMKLKIIQTCTPWMREFTPWTLIHNNSS